MSSDLKQKLTRPSIWLRLVYMIVLAIAFNIAEIVIFAVVVFQFLVTLFTRKPNARMTRFGRNMARYVQQIVAFLTFATEERPFPFSPWPNAPHGKRLAVEEAKPDNSESGAPKPAAKSTRTTAAKKRSPRSTARPRKPRTPPKKDM